MYIIFTIACLVTEFLNSFFHIGRKTPAIERVLLFNDADGRGRGGGAVVFAVA